MGDTTSSEKPATFSPVCGMVRELAEARCRIRKEHGTVVAKEVSKYFEKVSPRVKHGPEMNRLFSSTLVLAMAHQLINFLRDKEDLERFRDSIAKGLPLIPRFAEQVGQTPEQFMADMKTYIAQYRTLCRTDLDEGAGLMAYANLIEGGMTLPPLLVRMADFSLPFESGLEGLPSGEEISDSRKSLWSEKLRKVYFPLADMIGWSWVANSLRRNGVLWNPDLKDKLDIAELEMNEKRASLEMMCGILLNFFKQEISALSERPEFSGVKYVIHEPRMKSPAARVIKESQGRMVMDILATRAVFECDDKTAEALGYALWERIRTMKPSCFNSPAPQNHYRKPTPYNAYHITGYLRNGLLFVPCEMQVTDRLSYDDSVDGRASRLRYKAGMDLDKKEIYDAINKLLGPILRAAKDVTYAIRPSLPVSVERIENAVTYVASLNGYSKKFRLKEGITVIDGLVRFSQMTGMCLTNAEVYSGSSARGECLRPYATCPRQFYVVPREEALDHRAISQILDNPNVLDETKRFLLRQNGKS